MDGGGRDDGSEVRGLEDLARELRAGAGSDLRAEAEEDERLAAQAALRRRTLVDVAAEAAGRGAPVTVTCGSRRFAGTVRHAARDLLTLVTPAGAVHVNLDRPVVLRPEAGTAPASVPPRDEAPSFKARLYELEVAGAEVDVGLVTGPDELRGRLRAVAVDHVLVQAPGDSRSAVALSAIAYVRERRPG